jgi:hypothetical protein
MHLTLPLQVFPNRLTCFCINRNNIGVSPDQLDNRMVDHLNNFSSDVRQLFGELIDTYTFTLVQFESWNMSVLQEMFYFFSPGDFSLLSYI